MLSLKRLLFTQFQKEKEKSEKKSERKRVWIILYLLDISGVPMNTLFQFALIFRTMTQRQITLSLLYHGESGGDLNLARIGIHPDSPDTILN